MHALCLFQVMSTVQQTRVSWALSWRKAAPWQNSQLQKFGINMLYCLVFMLETSIRRFKSVLVSIWRQFWGFKKSWVSPVVITNVRHLGSFILIVLVSKELPNLLVRLTTIPANQPGSLPGIWECFGFLSSRHEDIRNFSYEMRKGHSPTRAWRTRGKTTLRSYSTNSSIPLNRTCFGFSQMSGSDGELIEKPLNCSVPTRYTDIHENQAPSPYHGI